MPLLSTMLLIVGVASAATRKGDCHPVASEPVPAAQASPFTLGVDARVELLSVVQALAAPLQDEHPYAVAVRAKFSKLARHAAVRGYAGWTEKGVPARIILETLLYASQPPELALPDSSVFPVTAPEPFGGRDKFEAFLGELRDFARAAKFEAYFASRQPAFDESLEQARKELAEGIPPEAMSAYLGVPFTVPHALILAPGFRDAQSLESMLWTSAQVTTVRFKTGDSFHLSQLGMSLVHELAHDVTQSWGQRYADQVQAFGGTMPPGCRMLGPQSWSSCLDEHIVRALEYRLLTLRSDGRALSDADRNEEQYPYQEALVKRLGEYEARRSCYPSLIDFYPRLVDAMKEAAPAIKAKFTRIPR